MPHESTDLPECKMEKLSNLFDKRQFSAYFCTVFSGLIETGSAACVQRMQGVLPPFELNAARYACQILMALCLVLATRASVKTVDAELIPSLLILALYSFLINTLYFTAAAYIPLGNLMVTHMVTMYITCVLFSRLFLQRETHVVQYAAFLFILAGELLLTQPWFHPDEPDPTQPPQHDYDYYDYYANSSTATLPLSLLQTPPFSETNLTLRTVTQQRRGKGEATAESMQLYGYALAMGAAVVSALRTFVYMTRISQVATSVLVLVVGAIAFVTSVLLSLYLESPVLWLSTGDTLLLTGHAVTATVSSLLVVSAQKVLQPVIYSILQNSVVLFGFIAQFSFPDLFITGNSNTMEVIGAVIVAVGIIGYVLVDQRIKSTWSLQDV